MKKSRIYGAFPFKLVAIHVGPEASGEMAQVAEKLSSCKVIVRGILELLQTEKSFEDQILELKGTLKKHSFFL